MMDATDVTRFATLLRDGHKLDEYSPEVVNEILAEIREVPANSIYRPLEFIVPALIDTVKTSSNPYLTGMYGNRKIVNFENMLTANGRKVGDAVHKFIKTMSKAKYELHQYATGSWTAGPGFRSLDGIAIFKGTDTNKYIVAATAAKSSNERTILAVVDVDTSKHVVIFKVLSHVVIMTETHVYKLLSETANDICVESIWETRHNMFDTAGMSILLAYVKEYVKIGVPSSKEIPVDGYYQTFDEDGDIINYQGTIGAFSDNVHFGTAAFDVALPPGEHDIYDFTKHVTDMYFRSGCWVIEVRDIKLETRSGTESDDVIRFMIVNKRATRIT